MILREVESELLKLLQRPEIIVLRGARQVGKTTLLHRLETAVQPNKSAFVNMDLPDYRNEFEKDPLAFAKRFGPAGTVLFLDEIQRCSNAGEGLKLIYDTEKTKLIVSGSSSLEFKTKILPFLVGRAFIINIHTFSFGEFLAAKDPALAKFFHEYLSSVTQFA